LPLNRPEGTPGSALGTSGMAGLDGELLGELFGAATRVGLGGVGRWVSETAVDDRFGLGRP
jgi:hypothetical protein